ncbi:5692_t:CDS:2, partial [Entrophospora sp. SA101]
MNQHLKYGTCVTLGDTPKGLSRRVFIWVCLVFCPRDDLTEQKKNIRDDMVVFTKFHQKNDQGGLD